MKILNSFSQISPLLHRVALRRHSEPERKALWFSANSLRSSVEQLYQRYKFGIIASFSLLIALLIQPCILSAQNFTQAIERTARFENPNDASNELNVYNIHGNVTIEGYDGDEVQITIRQKIEGPTREIDQAKKELELVVDNQGSNIYIYLDAPFITVKKESGRMHYRVDSRDVAYTFVHDFIIRVPRHSNIYASTINGGMVSIENTTRRVSASNVNGGLELTGIFGPTKARTVNGDINIEYAQNPTKDSDYQTINGTIEMHFPDDLSADIRFKSLHGELYTDFNNVERLQSRVETDKKQKGSGIRYKVDQFAPIRIGNGGPTFSFEVLNGDVFIKKIQS